MKLKILILYVFALSITFAQKTQYVILISFDGFRWDYSERGVTPNMDNIKKEGVHAFSLKPVFPTKTYPNHYSIITGMYPENHGIISNSFLNPYTNESYNLGNREAVRDSKWYLGEAFWETAERNGIICASYFWPGSEVDLEERRPKYYKIYDHHNSYKNRIDGAINWLKLPYSERPHFISLYFHDTDFYGHDYGPNSVEIDQSISRLDSLVGYLNNGLNEINLKDSVNIILLSDHGMTEISTERTINIDEILTGYDYEIGGAKPFMMIEPSKNNFYEVYDRLKENENHFKVYLREELPHRFHFSKHPFISSIILIADLGWSLVSNDWLNQMKKYSSKGNHGYDNCHIDMHGIFIAKGPVFKQSYKTSTIRNIDVYPLLCKIFGIHPRSNVDGKLEFIEHVLK